jgi:hypothetical protein
MKLQLTKNSLPQASTRLIAQMYLLVLGQKMFCIRTMFNTGTAIPIICSKFIMECNLPMITYEVPLRINGADSCPLSGAREAFMHSLILQYK